MKFRATGNRMELLERETLTSGSVGIYVAEFAFVSGWDGMLCSAVFRANNQVKIAPLDERGRCIIPHETLAAPSELLVGAFGVRDNSVVLTTEYVSAGLIVQGAERNGDPALSPEQTAYERILTEVFDLRQDIAEFEYTITAREAGREAAEESRVAAEQARVDENAGTVAKAAAQAGVAAGHAQAAAIAADRAMAEADRATVPPVKGVYNIILPDRVTGERYALVVEGGVLALLGVKETMEATETLHLIDAAGGHVYTLAVEAGELMMEEVS